jgi:cell division protein FtsN
MKNIFIVAFTLILLTSGCKVFKSSKKGEALTAKTETNTETKVFSVPGPQSAISKNTTPENINNQAEKPISVKSEKFTFSSKDKATYENKTFFVIVGSFKSNENANRFKKELAKQGFNPIILSSETGYFRVCVDSFYDEAVARNRVKKIRSEFPKYDDSWLLIKK